jgi:hypothetical protein
MTEETQAVEEKPQEKTYEMVIASLKDRRICLAYPSADHISANFSTSLLQLITASAPFVKLGVVNQISSRIAFNRNAIVQQARAIDATDILWMDADSIFPVQSLMHLLTQANDLAMDIVCAITCTRKGNHRGPIGLPLDLSSVQPYQKLVKMKQVGMPFMLTSMSVFDKLDASGFAPEKCYFAEPPRWMMRQIGWEIDGADNLVGEDEYFCYLVLKAGFDIWCDMQLSMQLGHEGVTVHYIEEGPAQDAAAKVDETLS